MVGRILGLGALIIAFLIPLSILVAGSTITYNGRVYGVTQSAVQAQTQCTKTFKAGSTVTMTATPCPGCVFEKWTCTGISPCPCAGQGKVCTFVMPTTPFTLNAVFTKKPPQFKWRSSADKAM